MSGGSKIGAVALFPFSSTNPDDKKSAHEGVVGLLRSLVVDLDVVLKPGPVEDLLLENMPLSPLSSKALPKPISSNRDQEGSFRLVDVAASETCDWFVDEIALSTRRHSSVSAWMGSSNAAKCRKAISSSRYWNCLARRRRAKGVGDTTSTIITNFVVSLAMTVDCGGYSTESTNCWSDRGRSRMPLLLPGSGVCDLR